MELWKADLRIFHQEFSGLKVASGGCKVRTKPPLPARPSPGEGVVPRRRRCGDIGSDRGGDRVLGRAAAGDYLDRDEVFDLQTQNALLPHHPQSPVNGGGRPGPALSGRAGGEFPFATTSTP